MEQNERPKTNFNNLLIDFNESCNHLILIITYENKGKNLIEHFTLEEFACKDRDPLVVINLDLLAYLDSVRVIYDSPITITSAFRTYTHNRKVKGVEYSSHLTGDALDILLPEDIIQKNNLICLCDKYFPITIISDHYIHCATRSSQKIS